MPIRRSPLPKRQQSIQRTRVKPVNRQRKAKSFARAYHSKARVEWVKRQPCAACLLIGYSENAHVGKQGKGAGRKGNADQIAPLCRSTPNRLGCHVLFDEFPTQFYERYPQFDAVQECAQTEQDWLASQEASV